MNHVTSCTLCLPDWLERIADGAAPAFADDKAAMRYVVQLAANNIEFGTGGPFAAAVIDPASGELVAAGVNTVTRSGLSIAHAEIIALSLAQKRLGDWNLSCLRPLTLVSSCEPCAMCYGALPWSGIRRLVCGARREDAERAGFDEGDKPADWVASLERRGIDVCLDLLREEASELFSRYRSSGGEIYNVQLGKDDE